MTLADNIKTWVEIDNEIREINEKLKILRNKKSLTQELIYTNFQAEKLDNTTIRITGGKLKLCETNYTPPLTLSFIEDCLKKCLSISDAEQILEFIKQSRNIRKINEIKRTINN